MTGLSFTDAAERVKSSLDIVDVIQRHVILKKAGRNFLGKCPFHNDKSPSMNVNRERGIFKCFACGVGGDTLTFLMKLRNQTYGEVIRELAEEQGLVIEDERRSPEVAQQQRDAKQKIQDLNAAAQAWFRLRLQDAYAEPVRAYLARRYPDAATYQAALERFELGYAPAGWENLTPHLKDRFDFVQANPDLLTTAGLANNRDHGQGHYDRFRNRLIIPIHDDRGQVVAFGGRALSDEDKPKYLNSPETIVYHKSNVLYGLYQAKDAIRQSRTAVVMEGYFDVMSAHLAGITEAIGSCGTAMTESHLKLLNRFGAETVVLAFDSDEAGLRAALSAIQLVEVHMGASTLQLKVLIVPDGKDPDDFLRAHGGEAFRVLMAEARHYLAFKFDMALRDLPLNTPDGRIQAANRLTPLLAAIHQPVVRAEYLKIYAERIGTPEEALALEVRRYEQATGRQFAHPANNLKHFDAKKAISNHGPSSLKRQRPLMTDNLSELRGKLVSRSDAAEKNLLRLTLVSPESYRIMMPLLQARNLTLSNPVLQAILDGLLGLWASETGVAEPARVDGSADRSFGTLLDRMNQLYLNEPDVLHTFAELVMTAESFSDSLGLGGSGAPAFGETVTRLAGEQVTQIERCRHIEQLRTLKAAALQDETSHPENQIELLYRFYDHLQASPAKEGPS